MALSPQLPRTPVVAVATVSFGSGDVLEGFLDSVPASSANPVCVVVADNGARDTVVARMTSASSADYLPLDRNRGYGGAMNEAIRSLPSDVEWVLVSNPDVVLSAGALDALVAAGNSDPRIGAVGPAIMTDGEVYPSARAIPSLRTGIGHALFANIWLGNPWTRAYRRDSSSDPVRRDAGWLSGACVLVRKSAFDELGGFDDGYFPAYDEDVDLCLGIKQIGQQVG